MKPVSTAGVGQHLAILRGGAEAGTRTPVPTERSGAPRPAARPPVRPTPGGGSTTPRHPSLAPTISRVLAITEIATALLGLANLTLTHSRQPSMALFGLALVCAAARWLDRRGARRASGALFLGGAFVATTFIAIVGNGLGDSAMLALPVLLVAGTMLFGRRAAPAVLAASLVAIVAIVALGPGPLVGDEPLATRVVSVCVLLAASAAFMAIVVSDGERYLERARRSEEEIQRAYQLTLEGWAKMLEYRDEETEGHSRRVAELSVALAAELGLDEQMVAHVRRGALLHDIGKVGVPDRILRKPGPLDECEMAIMRQHPVFARRMLEGIDFLEPALCIPYSHHERWDGTGYPDGLAGEAIPLLARLFAVVDHWEALTSDRPYRRAWSREDALAYIRANAGTAFDPRVVVAFLRVLQRGDGTQRAG